MKKIGIIGKGFVGSAVEFGFSAQTGCDAELRVYDKDKSKSTHTLKETVNKSDVIFVSVPTPSNTDGSMNLDIVEQALQDISDVNTVSDNVVLLRSTVTPGTTRKLQEKYPNLRIVFNPEFLTERNAKYDFINQARIIIGGGDTILQKHYVEKVGDLYRSRFGESQPVIETNWETAELIKYMSNCFFTTKISFLNEMHQIAEKCGVDWTIALDGFFRDGRVGHSHMNVPGPDGKFGFGGSCFPKDIMALSKIGKEVGYNLNILEAVMRVNEYQKSIITAKIKVYFNNKIDGLVFGVWGLSFKPNTDDIREAPSISIIDDLLNHGASIQAFDPAAIDKARQLFGNKITYSNNLYEAAEGVDALIINTEWSVFRTPDFSKLKGLMKNKVIFDGRNLYDLNQIKDLGFYYNSIGRETITEK